MSHRKTFIGRVLSVTQSKVVLSTQDPARGDAIALQAGAVVLERARALVGQVVRYTAEVSSETRCLSNPQFVIGSEFGLQAVSNVDNVLAGTRTPFEHSGMCDDWRPCSTCRMSAR